MGVKVLVCTCTDEYQDKKYGKRRRVHNKTKGGSENSPEYRCVTCANEKTVRMK